MKKIQIFIVSVLCLCLCQSCSQYQYGTFASIGGRVIDSLSQPIEGAVVNLNPSGKTAITDESGCFRFVGLEPKQYAVAVHKDGYDSDRKTVTVGAGEIVDITMILSKF